MTNVFYLGILVLIVIPTAILFIIFSRRKPSSTRKTLGWRAEGAIFCLYCVFLFLSAFALYLIPEKNFLHPEKDFLSQNDQEFQEEYSMHSMRDYLLQAAKEDRLNKTGGVFLVEKTALPYGGEELEILSLSEGDLKIPVIVEEKEENDDTIEAAYYTTKALFKGVDLTDKIKVPRLELSGNRLMMIGPDRYKVRLIEFKEVFTTTQFIKNKPEEWDREINLLRGQRILHLQIPKKVKIKGTDVDVNFIGENGD